MSEATITHTGLENCACSTCTGAGTSTDSVSLDVSLDGQTGNHTNGKAIWTPEQIAAYLNRTGTGWNNQTGQATQSDGDLSTILFGFHTSQGTLAANGYVFTHLGAGYGVSEYFNFAPFSAAQQAAAREAMQSWDDVIAVNLREATNINTADISLSNLASAPTTQAYAFLPSATIRYYTLDSINVQLKDLAGDVWVSASQASNFQLDEGRYGMQTLTHEIGHALGISHPGGYNAAPGVSITYGPNAEYAQDTRAYTIMSYFEASSLGARHFDFHMSATAYSGVPLIHDILAAQRIYGADMTTRTGDTVYGFNSNADRDTFDFNKTPAPIGAIWDAGGIDTIDTSGYATTQLIDLRAGSLSSIGGVTYDTAPTFAQVNANRAAQGIAAVPLATYNANMAALLANPVVGRLTDNFGIAYGVTIENAIGGSGADTIIGNDVANVLTGNAGDDTLTGAGGDDTLDGGVGNDTMKGGIGNDLYFVDVTGDAVTELAGEGTDTVSSGINYTLGAEIENLILTGTAVSGTGNDLDNTITGNDLNNLLSGGAGNDTLIGGIGNDTLNGGVGADSMSGGKGNDLYFVDNSGDRVIELNGGGNDTVSSSVSYTLGDDVENLILTGGAAGTGNGLDNTLTGNAASNQLGGGAGNDRLIGGDGVDFLTGGAGNDVFVAEINATKVASKSGPISLDVVLDFGAGDKIDLSGIDANTTMAGHQAFNFVGNASGKGAGELSLQRFGNMNAAEKALGMEIDGIDGASTFEGPVTILLGNVDGGDYDFAMAFVGTPSLNTTDLIFN
jgi:serralysin